jgi:hypothetical protein
VLLLSFFARDALSLAVVRLGVVVGGVGVG